VPCQRWRCARACTAAAHLAPGSNELLLWAPWSLRGSSMEMTDRAGKMGAERGDLGCPPTAALPRTGQRGIICPEPPVAARLGGSGWRRDPMTGHCAAGRRRAQAQGAGPRVTGAGRLPGAVDQPGRRGHQPGQLGRARTRRVLVRGAEAELTPAEWGVLVTLSTVPGRVYSRFEPDNPAIIQPVLGGGYRLVLAGDG
jgi:hypothetical protein